MFENEETDSGEGRVQIEEEMDTEEFLALLPDELGELIEYLLDGLPHAQISKKMQCSERTIQERLRLIRVLATEFFF